MALIKEKITKGYPAEYWKITWVRLNSMDYSFSCELCLYKDKASRGGGRQNMLERQVFTWSDPASFMTIAQLTSLECFGWAYMKIKESKLSNAEIVLDENGAPVLDENGEPTFTGDETNWFHDALDVLEV